MQLGWNEIKLRAIQFSREWAGETREDAESKSFWDAFFNVFGIPRRSVATFEEPVRKLGGRYGLSTCSGKVGCWSSTSRWARAWIRPSRRPSIISSPSPARVVRTRFPAM